MLTMSVQPLEVERNLLIYLINLTLEKLLTCLALIGLTMQSKVISFCWHTKHGS